MRGNEHGCPPRAMRLASRSTGAARLGVEEIRPSVLRVDGEALAQREALGAAGVGERGDLRPRGLGVHVVAGDG